jgi:hypothetical protein
MSPEGTHSLLSVCYSAFRDRLTQTRDFQQSLFRLPRHLGVAALLRGVVTLLTVFEKSTTFFFRSSSFLRPRRHSDIHSLERLRCRRPVPFVSGGRFVLFRAFEVNNLFFGHFPLPPAQPLSDTALFELLRCRRPVPFVSGGQLVLFRVLRSQQPFFGCFSPRPSFEIRPSGSRLPPNLLPSNLAFRPCPPRLCRPLPSSAGGQ